MPQNQPTNQPIILEMCADQSSWDFSFDVGNICFSRTSILVTNSLRLIFKNDVESALVEAYNKHNSLTSKHKISQHGLSYR